MPVNNPPDTSNLVPYTGGTADITIAHDIEIDSDSKKLFLGNGQDASIYYDGISLVITSNETGSGYTAFSNGIRMTAGRVVQHKVVLVIGDTTPSVSAGNVFITSGGRGAGTIITDFDNGAAGQIIHLVSDDNTLTIANNANIQLAGSANFAMSDGDTLTLCYGLHAVTKWTELSRMTV
jgi:hypothetical protein